ncbi:Cys-tRNA(Pro) deacylase [Shewanella youngdeokensis]|uniref:Cys-tRNA(Pro)/Cys-tRNA(Cys) deacylase n=1 Tax=Shewanella youngdeokensis TaxID=2999068 RepID=A0ABZ0K4F6_9GAMM|nr:Cys-tRNA(Pro) deacylase [Shewanella sp. DAU334]
MTPAITTVKKNSVPHQIHEFSHDDSSGSYGLEAAKKMSVSELRVFKTLVVALDEQSFAVGVIPVSSQLSMKRFAKELGAKKAVMADKVDVERVTGYVLGGVSPLGQKKRLKTVIDQSANDFSTIYVSAGRRGLEIELSPNDVRIFTDGRFADICQ